MKKWIVGVEMPIVTRRNGKLLLILGLLLTAVGFIGGMLTYSITRNRNWGFTPLGGVLIVLEVPVGPSLFLAGISILVVSGRRGREVRTKLLNILKIDLHSELESLARQLGIAENDVVAAVHKLRSEGVPITIEKSTSEIVYNPSLLERSKPSRHRAVGKFFAEWNSYEKASLFIAVAGILVGILLQILR